MEKGKNGETLAKASKKNSNEVCLTEEELESASGGRLETGHYSEILPDGNRIDKCTVRWKVLGIFPKNKTFNSLEEANNWLEKNEKIAEGFRFK